MPIILLCPPLYDRQAHSTVSWGLRKGRGWSLVFFCYLNLERSTIQPPGSGSARCRDSRCTTAPSCCRRADCSCNYGLCDGPSVLSVFCRKTPGRNLRRSTGKSSALDFCTLFFSLLIFSWRRNTCHAKFTDPASTLKVTLILSSISKPFHFFLSFSHAPHILSALLSMPINFHFPCKIFSTCAFLQISHTQIVSSLRWPDILYSNLLTASYSSC